MDIMVLKSSPSIQPYETKAMDDFTHIINGMDIEGKELSLHEGLKVRKHASF